MKDYNLGSRSIVIGSVATVIVIVYIIRLLTLQIMSDDYKKNADSNAFQKKLNIPRAVSFRTVTGAYWFITSRHTTLWLS